MKFNCPKAKAPFRKDNTITQHAPRPRVTLQDTQWHWGTVWQPSTHCRHHVTRDTEKTLFSHYILLQFSQWQTVLWAGPRHCPHWAQLGFCGPTERAGFIRSPARPGRGRQRSLWVRTEAEQWRRVYLAVGNFRILGRETKFSQRSEKQSEYLTGHQSCRFDWAGVQNHYNNFCSSGSTRGTDFGKNIFFFITDSAYSESHNIEL